MIANGPERQLGLVIHYHISRVTESTLVPDEVTAHVYEVESDALCRHGERGVDRINTRVSD